MHACTNMFITNCLFALQTCMYCQVSSLCHVLCIGSLADTAEGVQRFTGHGGAGGSFSRCSGLLQWTYSISGTTGLLHVFLSVMETVMESLAVLCVFVCVQLTYSSVRFGVYDLVRPRMEARIQGMESLNVSLHSLFVFKELTAIPSRKKKKKK